LNPDGDGSSTSDALTSSIDDGDADGGVPMTLTDVVGVRA
jgi:hypothetical protein